MKSKNSIESNQSQRKFTQNSPQSSNTNELSPFIRKTHTIVNNRFLAIVLLEFNIVMLEKLFYATTLCPMWAATKKTVRLAQCECPLPTAFEFDVTYNKTIGVNRRDLIVVRSSCGVAATFGTYIQFFCQSFFTCFCCVRTG